MKILVTAGPTREPVDAVRFLSNRSSGKMGYAVAATASERGHEVVLVSGPVSLRAPDAVRVLAVETAEQMLKAVEDTLKWCEVLVMAAAVSDWRPASVSNEKLRKDDMPDNLPLARTPDILMTVSKLKGTRLFVGFAAEREDILVSARSKLAKKGLDLIVANDISRTDSGFESDTNKAMLISVDGLTMDFPLINKVELAGHILDWIEQRQTG